MSGKILSAGRIFSNEGAYKTLYWAQEVSNGTFEMPSGKTAKELLVAKFSRQPNPKIAYGEFRLNSIFKEIAPKIYFIKIKNVEDPVTLDDYLAYHKNVVPESFLIEKSTCSAELTYLIDREDEWETAFEELKDLVKIITNKGYFYTDIKFPNLCKDDEDNFKMIDFDPWFFIKKREGITDEEYELYMMYQIYIQLFNSNAGFPNGRQQSFLYKYVGSQNDIERVITKLYNIDTGNQVHPLSSLLNYARQENIDFLNKKRYLNVKSVISAIQPDFNDDSDTNSYEDSDSDSDSDMKSNSSSQSSSSAINSSSQSSSSAINSSSQSSSQSSSKSSSSASSNKSAPALASSVQKVASRDKTPTPSPVVPIASSEKTPTPSPVVPIASSEKEPVISKPVNKTTRRARKPITKPCPEGTERNPLTGRCKKIKQLKPCPEGYERDPNTKRCRKIKIACPEGTKRNKCKKNNTIKSLPLPPGDAAN